MTCPFCMMQLEMGQLKLAEKRRNPYNIPVLFYLELLGLSLGLEPKDLGMNLHRIDNESLLARLPR